MTPRQADVAFVLEGVPGVRAVYAVVSGRLSTNFDFAVELDSVNAMVAAHYALLRSDGGEPFYRTLWRMKPELRARTVLITPADAAPPSARDTKLPRILERPASRARIAEIIAAFRR